MFLLQFARTKGSPQNPWTDITKQSETDEEEKSWKK